MLRGDFSEGDLVRVDAKEGRLTFERIAGTNQEA
jgi:hypothetical protein